MSVSAKQGEETAAGDAGVAAGSDIDTDLISEVSVEKNHVDEVAVG